MKKATNSVTISDIAKAAGVSKTTISNYLNKRFSSISDETKQRIDAIVEETNYHPNNFARSLRASFSGMVGCLVADITSKFSSRFVHGVCDTCGKNGYRVLFLISDNNAAIENAHIEQLLSNGVDGIALYSVGGNDDEIVRYSRSGTPIVLGGRVHEKSNCLSHVTTNNFDATYHCMQYLFEQGYSKVSYLSRPINTSSQRLLRYQAYEKAASELFHQAVDGYTLVNSCADRESYRLFLEELLAANRDEDIAFFAADGTTMHQFMYAFRESKQRISEHIGICGFDDWEWADLVGPGITTIKSDAYSIGVKTAELLIKQIHQESASVEHIILESQLIPRQSTERRLLQATHQSYSV